MVNANTKRMSEQQAVIGECENIWCESRKPFENGTVP